MVLPHDRRGSGPPLVLLHFTGGTRRIWEPVRDALAARHETIAFDLPGFGEAAPIDATPTIEAIAARVTESIRELGLDQPAVAGISLGGGVALELARIGAVRRAAAISPVGFATPREQRWAHSSLTLLRATAKPLAAVADVVARIAPLRIALTAQYFGRPWRVPAGDFADTLRSYAGSEALQASVDNVAFWRFGGGVPADVPVTIVWGSRDALLLPRQGRRAGRVIPHARLVELPGCGHVPFYDDHDAVVRALVEN
jgi:pimeloyl-ACP methyl ester carboxylesterase